VRVSEVPVDKTAAEEKVGAVVSIVTELASRFVALVFPAASATVPERSRRISVPSLEQATVMVTEMPLEAEGVKVEQLAVPWLAKSAAMIPVTVSEKARV
jgi:hypothetical protein